MAEEEQRLIRLAQRGDNAALAELLHSHYAFVGKYLLKITLQPHLADDLTQDTMLRAMEKINLYNGKSKFSSWLITLATRLYIDGERKKKRERRYAEQEHALRELRWRTEHRDDNWPELLDALGRLAPAIRLPLILKHYYGYAYAEISGMLDIPEGTAKSRIHEGMRRLRKEMANDEET